MTIAKIYGESKSDSRSMTTTAVPTACMISSTENPYLKAERLSSTLAAKSLLAWQIYFPASIPDDGAHAAATATRA